MTIDIERNNALRVGGVDLGPRIVDMAREVAQVPGVAAVVLGGSRARGTHRADSDIDIGIYYTDAERLDLARLNRVASDLDDAHRSDIVCAPGGWGPWVNAGGWLRVDGVTVDWVLRDLGRVEQVLREGHAGIVRIDAQAGHPFGFVSAICVGEVAACQPISDPQGQLQRLRSIASTYPEALARGIVDAAFWEVGFNLSLAEKALSRADATYLAGCAFRAVTGLALCLHALNRAHWLNEKGAVEAVEALPLRPRDWRARVTAALAALVSDTSRSAVQSLRELHDEVEALLRPLRSPQPANTFDFTSGDHP